MNNKILAEDVIKYSVQRIEQLHGHETTYSNLVDKMSRIVLKNISEQDVQEIIEYYLYTWGNMGRVLGQFQYFMWQDKIAQLIKQNSAMLENFRLLQLQNVQLNDNYQQITELYDSFKLNVGNIAAVKIMHIICPNFFPLWDNAIANGLRVEYYTNGTYEAFSGQDYFEFMKSIQSIAQKYAQLWSYLANFYNRSMLKIIDEHLLWTVRRPFSLIV